MAADNRTQVKKKHFYTLGVQSPKHVTLMFTVAVAVHVRLAYNCIYAEQPPMT